MIVNTHYESLLFLPPRKPLADLTWAEIEEISARGLASSYFQVGDVKDNCKIVAIDADTPLNSSHQAIQNGSITFIVSSPGTDLDRDIYINTYDPNYIPQTKSVNWKDTVMGKQASSRMALVLPEDCLSRLKLVKKPYYQASGSTQTAVTSYDYIFPPGLRNMGWSASYDDVVYPGLNKNLGISSFVYCWIRDAYQCSSSYGYSSSYCRISFYIPDINDQNQVILSESSYTDYWGSNGYYRAAPAKQGVRTHYCFVI